MRRIIMLVTVALVMAAGLTSPVWAQTIAVNSLADDADPTDGECTLREAISAANTDTPSGTATGECAAGSGNDLIDVGVTGTVNLTGVLPDLTTNMEIEGPGADQFSVRRDTGGDYRIFTVTSGSVVSISGITITNGNTRGDGGGIFNDGGNLTIADSTISSNTGNRGGGVYSSTGNLTSGLTTTITNSTLSGNTATTFVGGGLYNFGGLTVVEHSTITDNTSRDSDSDGSGVFSFGDTSTRTEVLSSIISANSNTDVDSHTTNSFDSNGYNLIGDGNATAAFNQTGDQTGVSDPGLDPLDSYGGTTQTHRLQSDSPAVDAGPPSTSCPPPPTDQRGVTRPQDGDADSTPTCDIGSFELEEPPDTTAPRVISTVPANGGEVGPAANIRATFSEDMRPASVKRAFKLFMKGSTTQIAAQVSYDATTDRATLNPNNNLRWRGVTYKAVVSTVAKDVEGNRLDQDSSAGGLQQKVWFFEID